MSKQDTKAEKRQTKNEYAANTRFVQSKCHEEWRRQRNKTNRKCKLCVSFITKIQACSLLPQAGFHSKKKPRIEIKNCWIKCRCLCYCYCCWWCCICLLPFFYIHLKLFDPLTSSWTFSHTTFMWMRFVVFYACLFTLAFSHVNNFWMCLCSKSSHSFMKINTKKKIRSFKEIPREEARVIVSAEVWIFVLCLLTIKP